MLEKDFYKKKNKVFFLDRDGVINIQSDKKKLNNPYNFFSYTFKALRLICENNYKIIIITNQPGVAKGFITYRQMKILNQKYINFFNKKKIIISSLLFCPHHPDKGFVNENLKYKKQCDCRKPNTKLFFTAKKRFNIDFKKSIYIGDNYVDYLAAKKLKIKFFSIGEINLKKTKNFKTLYEAVKFIFRK